MNNQIMVKFKPKVDRKTKENIHHKHGCTVVRKVDRFDVDVIKSLPEHAMKKIVAYRGESNVLLVEEDKEIQALDIETDNSWGVVQVGGIDAQNSGITGVGVKVGVIDTGIDYTHPELAVIYKGGYNFVAGNSDPMDDHGHGTHCAGIIAANKNGVGCVGVAPGVDIYSLKVLDSNGSGQWSATVAAVDWCIGHGIQITSNSYGGPFSEIIESVFQSAYDAGILSIAAAGNSGGSDTLDKTSYPGRCTSVVAVAATDSNNARASFSSTGPATEVSAPGVNIYSTVPIGTPLGDPSGYRNLSGTSMACPHVTGIVALAKSAHQDWTNDMIRGQLRATATDLGVTGHDWLYGFGLVNAVKACETLVPNPPPMPPLPPQPEPPTVQTNLPTDLTPTSIVFHGEVTSLGSSPSVNVQFLWGICGTGGTYFTPNETLSGLIEFSYSKTDLVPNTHYYTGTFVYIPGEPGTYGENIFFDTPEVSKLPTVLAVSPSYAER